jgi:hypothetical protein
MVCSGNGHSGNGRSRNFTLGMVVLGLIVLGLVQVPTGHIMGYFPVTVENMYFENFTMNNE